MTLEETGGAIRERAGGCTVAVRVQPGAKRTAVLGVYGEGAQARLKIALQAPAVDGRANEALIAFLAELLGVARSRVEIAGGEFSREKTCLLLGVTRERAALSLFESRD